MGLERAALTHNCNVIRRQVLDEFSDLTLVFVVHGKDGHDRAIAEETGRFSAASAGKEIVAALKKAAKENRDGLLGLIPGEHKDIFGLRRIPHYYALFMIDASGFASMEEAQRNLYHLVWHGIDLYESYKTSRNTNYKREGNLILPRHTPLTLSTANLMADVFAAILLALLGHDYRQIRKMAQWRANLTLSPTLHYRAELYPSPVAMETAEMVYEDLKDTLDPRLKLYHRALQLADETGLSHDEQSIKQWWGFSARAQEMAWIGCTPQQIMNAAVYTSEDPYVKASAYLVAEALGIEPAMFSDTGSYNPFAEGEVNERAHAKLCDKVFGETLSRVRSANDPNYFHEEAQHQNNRLALGHITGWCAPAMLALAESYGTPDSSPREVFSATRDIMPWAALQKLARNIMKLRRSGGRLTADALDSMVRDDPALLPAAQAFRATEGKEFKPVAGESKTPGRYNPNRREADLPPIMAHLQKDDSER